MNFKQMKAMVLAQKHPEAGWCYSGRWQRVFYDDKRDVCYTGYKKRSGYSSVDDAVMIFRPDDIAVYDCSGADYFQLRGLTINGAVRKCPTYLSRYMYIHDLVNRYEVVPSMEISMKTGKPINARLLEKIKVDHHRMREVNNIIRRLRAPIATWLRVGDNKVPEQPSKMWANNSHDMNIETLVKIIESYDGDDFFKYKNWMNRVLIMMSLFYTSTRGAETQASEIRRFDNMVKFHKAALFRQLGVIK